jgi:hypothetical protein
MYTAKTVGLIRHGEVEYIIGLIANALTSVNQLQVSTRVLDTNAAPPTSLDS